LLMPYQLPKTADGRLHIADSQKNHDAISY
jgi:hypothetical protein